MGFFETLVHLLPRAKAWRVTAAKQLRAFLEGLGASFDAPREFVDDVWGDAFPETTRELAEWEKQFGLDATGLDEAQRRTQLAAAWAAQGGQDPKYIQDTLQAAGFPLYVHEWWDPGEPLYTARDPRLYTTQPLIGTVQCGEPLAQCGEPLALCNAFLANEPGYIVNLDLTPRAPPPVPDDPTKWPFFLYLSGETFPDAVSISNEQRAALERLVLKICPTQQWIVMRVVYGEPGEGIFDETFGFTFN